MGRNLIYETLPFLLGLRVELLVGFELGQGGYDIDFNAGGLASDCPTLLVLFLQP